MLQFIKVLRYVSIDIKYWLGLPLSLNNGNFSSKWVINVGITFCISNVINVHVELFIMIHLNETGVKCLTDFIWYTLFGHFMKLKQSNTSPFEYRNICSVYHYFDDLVQNCSISSVLAMEILQSCTKPSISWPTHLYGCANTNLRNNINSTTNRRFMLSLYIWTNLTCYVIR